MKKLLLFLLLTGCTAAPTPKIESHESDSILVKSESTFVKSTTVFKQVDKSINKKVNKVIKEIVQLKIENKQLTKAASIKTIIRDTIYITEKKNFWGKTKKITDSSQGVSIDTLENQ